MLHNKRQLGVWAILILVLISLLCGCSRIAESALAHKHADRHRNADPRATESLENAGMTGQIRASFPRITVIDTLPAVDETVPVEPTPLPSSEIINIIGQKEEEQRIWKEDGTFSDERLNVYHVIFHDHDVSFAMPNFSRTESGQIMWQDSGVGVRYMGERELETLRELDEKNVVGEDCQEFNEGMEKTRQLIAEGFLQDAFANYLSMFPELGLEDKELTLELTYAGRTDRREDNTSWWELDYNLSAGLEDGSSLTLAEMDITRVFLVQGEENTWDDAHYRIWGYPYAMWELLEQPKEDMGETFLTVLPEGTFTDEGSIYSYMEQYAKERQITWECGKESSFWYDYLIWKGEGGGYQYQVAVPVTDGDAGSWMIQAKIKKGAEKPEECWYALRVFMQTFHANAGLDIV